MKSVPGDLQWPFLIRKAVEVLITENQVIEEPDAKHVAVSRRRVVSVRSSTLGTRLREAGDLLGIRLLDHLILGDERLYSFADQGWPL